MTFQDKKPFLYSLLVFFVVMTSLLAVRILLFTSVEVDLSSIAIDPKISPLWINTFLYKEGYNQDTKNIKIIYTNAPQDLYRFSDVGGQTIKSFRTERKEKQLFIYAQYDSNLLNAYATRATDAEVRESLNRDIYAAICASYLKDTSQIYENCYSQADNFSQWLNTWWLKKLLSFQLIKPVAASCAGALDCGVSTYGCLCSGGDNSGSDCSSNPRVCLPGGGSCNCTTRCLAGNYNDCSAVTNQASCQNRNPNNSCAHGCNGRPETRCTWYNSGVTPTPGGGGGTTPTSYNPIGSHDTPYGICNISGWACDQDSWSTQLNIHIYESINGNNYANPIQTTGDLLANLSTSGADATNIASRCGGTSAHRFSYQLPETYWDGYNHTIYAYAINVNSSGQSSGGNNPALPESVVGNRITNCCPATTAPTGLSPSGSITAGARNITWNAVAGAISYTLTVTPSTGQANSYNITGTSQSYTFVAGVTYTLTVRANFRGACGSGNTARATVTVPQPTITLSGSYLSSPTCSTSSTNFANVSLNANTVTFNPYAPGVVATNLFNNRYSLTINKPVSGSVGGTLTVTIPDSSPYVCCNNNLDASDKTCSYSVTVSSTSGNLTQDILVVPAVTISGNVYETTTSAPANLCSLPGSTYPNVSPASVSLFSPSHGNSALGSAAVTNGVYTLNNVRSDWNYDLRLSFSNPSSLYRCACPTAFGSTTTNCQYTSLNFSSVASRTRNFYLIDTRMAATAWFQIFGGNAFATGSIHSVVPPACNSTSNCVDALMASVSSNSLSSGFPVSQASDTNSIQTTNDALSYHSYIHQTPSDGGRADNANNNSYQVGSQVQLASYQELLAKLTVVPEERTESTLDLASWRSASFWGSEDTHFIRVTAPEVLLTDQSHFTLTPGEKILVIVNGNLSIRNTGASNTKITQVPEGAFLGFIVSGNITIENSVGADISLSDPSALPATRDNAQLSGVFYANEQLIVEAYSDPPDRKLIAAGTFVGRQAVDLQRRFETDGTNNAILNSYQAVENFIFRPDFVANWPQGLRIAATNWRQINPRYVPAE